MSIFKMLMSFGAIASVFSMTAGVSAAEPRKLNHAQYDVLADSGTLSSRPIRQVIAPTPRQTHHARYDAKADANGLPIAVAKAGPVTPKAMHYARYETMLDLGITPGTEQARAYMAKKSRGQVATK